MQVDVTQGSPEWLLLRKSKITATDAPVIMGASKWKTRVQLYREKIDPTYTSPVNERMKRGNDLEPLARQMFTIQTGIHVEPKVFVKDWAMASLDGIDESGKTIVEIKCPGAFDHQSALSGVVPGHYVAQMQHQMYVCDVDKSFYFSFDGEDGVAIEVKRDESYIERMVEEEKKFYDNLISKVPPEPSEDDYLQMDDEEWEELSLRWNYITESMKQLEQEQDYIKKKLVLLSGESNAKGAGISLCLVKRRGNVDYSKIPQLKGVNLNDYRKEDILSWRVTSS